MDTTELIKNALDWADKRLTLQDQNLTETQRTYISFALSQNLVENFALSGVVKSFYCLDEVHRGKKDRCKQQCEYCTGFS
tara:strand:+ start:115 stop:354 length:240 start_codon:yes stop_codon:yes gene_type:complete